MYSKFRDWYLPDGRRALLMARGCVTPSRVAPDAPRASQAPRPGRVPNGSLHLADTTPQTDASPTRFPRKIATAAPSFFFAEALVAPQTPVPLPLRSQASLAPLASPRLLRAAPPGCSWLTWGQDNPEPKVVVPEGRG
ncbi:MAG: hypothetical protein NT154_23170, partial [Verrucomicrobia bacterium]|nr:hypothetical protein [Verrucomicrobiota bacterium]